MKMGVIRSLAGQHPVRKLCRTLGVARSACHAAQKKEERPRAKENARLRTRARELFAATGGIYGRPRLTVALRRAGERRGRHRVARLMAQAGLRARQKRRFRPRTTDGRHLCPIAPNRLAERPEPPARPGFGVAGGHHLGGDTRGLALRGGCHRRLQPQDRGLSPRMARCPRGWSPVPSSAPSRHIGPEPGLLHHQGSR